VILVTGAAGVRVPECRAFQRSQAMNRMVRYKIKPDRAEENERYITKVFEQLKQTQPKGLRYASFKLNDGATFVHIVSIEPEASSHPLKQLETFRAFTDTIDERCEELPVTWDLEAVGTYRLFDP
jgi:hypothetical protein